MFSDAEIDRARVVELLERVGLDDLLERLPAGIDTEVGEGRIQLSGGEKQRVGIARALYRDPALLVLDEPTSALDGLNEEAIFELLQAERERRTVILITHRRPDRFVFDRVLTVDAGTVSVSTRHDGSIEPIQ
jgi:ABC-type bacteriocin/lantibiotic exporter with double-glycine peptidase domain